MSNIGEAFKSSFNLISFCNHLLEYARQSRLTRYVCVFKNNLDDDYRLIESSRC
jgi:hypothetical protein